MDREGCPGVLTGRRALSCRGAFTIAACAQGKLALRQRFLLDDGEWIRSAGKLQPHFFESADAASGRSPERGMQLAEAAFDIGPVVGQYFDDVDELARDHPADAGKTGEENQDHQEDREAALEVPLLQQRHRRRQQEVEDHGKGQRDQQCLREIQDQDDDANEQHRLAREPASARSCRRCCLDAHGLPSTTPV